MEKVTTSWKEKFLYGFGDFGGNMMWSFTGAFLMQYFTDSVLISAGFLGTMMLVCRLFDGVSDMLMGLLIENTHSKRGKARVWFGASAIPMVLVFILLFTVPHMSMKATMVYVTVLYFLFTVILFTANNLSYHAMLSRISNDEVDQSKTSAVRCILAGLAMALSTALAPILLEALGGSKNPKAWVYIVIPYAVLSLITEAICYFNIHEKPEIAAISTEKRAKGETMTGLKELLRLPYFYIAVAIFTLNYFVTNSTQAMGVYYTRDVLGNATYYSLFSMIPMATMAVGLVLSPILIKRFGKRVDLIVCGVFFTLGSAISCFAPYSLAVCLIGLTVKGIGGGILAVELFTLAPDIIRLIEKRKGIRVEGLATAANSFGSKLGMGFGVATTGWLLDAAHYDPTASTQTEEVLRMQILGEWWLPLIGGALILICTFFWDIEKKLKG